MTEKPQSFWDRLKRFALWQWGLICIFSGLMVNMLMMAGRPTHRLSVEESAALYGGLAGTSLVIITGVVLIVMHLVRRKSKP